MQSMWRANASRVMASLSAVRAVAARRRVTEVQSPDLE
jgi:hypothetical protein